MVMGSICVLHSEIRKPQIRSSVLGFRVAEASILKIEVEDEFGVWTSFLLLLQQLPTKSMA